MEPTTTESPKPKRTYLAEPPEDISNIVWINHEEIAAAQETGLVSDNDGIGIWIYNIRSNKWRLEIEYPKTMRSYLHEICYNTKTKILWIYGDSSNMINVNMDTKEIKIIKSNARYVGQCPKLFFIKDKLHVICGSDSKYHLVWNDVENKFDDPVFTFSELNAGNHAHVVVHLKQKNVLYLFGGYDYQQNYYLKSIWKCDIDDNFKWTKLAIKLKQHVSYDACVVTADEKIVVIFQSPKICLFHVEQEKLEYLDGNFNQEKYGLLTCDRYKNENDTIIISGYIRNVSKEYGLIMPLELIELICKYYLSEIIYLVEDVPRFYKIALDDVFL